MKAVAEHRKDTNYTNNLRKEVIHIVEPFRCKVITMDERVRAVEKILIALEGELHEYKHDTDHRISSFVTQDRIKGYIDRAVKGFRSEVTKVHEKLDSMIVDQEGIKVRMQSEVELTTDTRQTL